MGLATNTQRALVDDHRRLPASVLPSRWGTFGPHRVGPTSGASDRRAQGEGIHGRTLRRSL